MYCSNPNCDNCHPYKVCDSCGEKHYTSDDENECICEYCGCKIEQEDNEELM